MEDSFSTDAEGLGQGTGGGIQAVMPAKLHSLARPGLTACCAAQFLTGHTRTTMGPWGYETPDIKHDFSCFS